MDKSINELVDSISRNIREDCKRVERLVKVSNWSFALIFLAAFILSAVMAQKYYGFVFLHFLFLAAVYLVGLIFFKTGFRIMIDSKVAPLRDKIFYNANKMAEDFFLPKIRKAILYYLEYIHADNDEEYARVIIERIESLGFIDKRTSFVGRYTRNLDEDFELWLVWHLGKNYIKSGSTRFYLRRIEVSMDEGHCDAEFLAIKFFWSNYYGDALREGEVFSDETQSRTVPIRI